MRVASRFLFFTLLYIYLLLMINNIMKFIDILEYVFNRIAFMVTVSNSYRADSYTNTCSANTHKNKDHSLTAAAK